MPDPKMKVAGRRLQVSFRSSVLELDQLLSVRELLDLLDRHVSTREVADVVLFLDPERMAQGHYSGEGWSIEFTVETAAPASDSFAADQHDPNKDQSHESGGERYV